ncbi:flagellar hook protein FlgE [Novimethylophilus kurashikiensis]|uniref:Flagellar hook protein FlgE n=1 Tax=Novimethylophilus kurashikiensis TaxID=1825523 RepID=A0A2R5F9P0_9PROT|nr:hypothetical protein [Novimethylophilus kurashikiensis]GBG14258.1 flagellar hook protein FlgE [Novimethylophilus kurashikiensis]
MEKKVAQPETPDWYSLLDEAIKEPGQLAAAHKFFHKYSLVNRWLASSQLRHMGLPLTPINTYGTRDKESGEGKSGWLALKRQVKKGETASIALIMPVPVKRTVEKEDGTEERVVAFNRFILRKQWFHMGQTEGDEVVVEASAGDWLMSSALDFLEVTEVPFTFTSVTDTRLGFAEGRTIAVSPLETNPTYGRIRQLARVVLGHTAETLGKNVPEDAAMQQVEAETTAYLVGATLGFSGLETTRAELQAALEGKRIPDKLAQHAFAAADRILNAGLC